MYLCAEENTSKKMCLSPVFFWMVCLPGFFAIFRGRSGGVYHQF